MPAFYQLDFERPIREIEERIARAKSSPAEIPALPGIEAREVPSVETPESLLAERERILGELYARLSPWNTVRVARHPNRPQTRDYIALMCRDFVELHGDRRFGDDPALVTGFGRIGQRKCLVVGHQKGKNTQEKIACHFGCAHPEGYRKALAKMKLAEKFHLPIVTLVDTPGAYPGVGAEQRGQAEAIAVNLLEMSRLRTPIVSVIIGEGGSGGALGIAVADRVGMLQYSWYSVISPEGCAAILWKQANEQTNSAAADALRLTARDNLELGIIDAIIPEPIGAAHRDPSGAAAALQVWITHQLDAICDLPIDQLVEQRYQRFRRMGQLAESKPRDEAPDSVGT
ncbi:MAG: acetyl-CoA carboxylase carboxyltransferase subunit alpha [Phycisphaerales bacterium]|nr:acetyl-CoA carboxylase carboxyltransferase subunit alpha [Phycisphaerales bacterium]